MTQAPSKTWNRSSALSPEELGLINTAVANVMARAAKVKEENSLTDEQTREVFAAVIAEMDAKIDAFVTERHQQGA
jgi:hypothetical protein